MRSRDHKRKKTSIFRIFLIPLIIIMLIQSIITMGTLVVRRTAEMLQEHSSSMMNRLVENRRVILQNDMNQRWASVHEKEDVIGGLLGEFLNYQNADIDAFLESDEMKRDFLGEVFPEFLAMQQNSSTTGIFLILTDKEMEKEGDFEGFFIRDSDPDTSPANYTDLLLERGSKQLSREWNIPLDTCWTTRFHMDGMGSSDVDNYFYEPWRAGAEYPDVDIENLGYWSMPFSLEKGMPDSYEMITYSLPLRYEGQIYGVMGVEVSDSRFADYFPVMELNDSQQSGYVLAVKQNDNSYRPLVGKGMLYNLVSSIGDTFELKETRYDSLSLVKDVKLDQQGIYAVICPMKLYSNNVPYENTEWVLLGLDTEMDLFGISRQLYVWMAAAILVGLVFGVFGIYIVVKYLTRPVQSLMQCISKGSAGLQEFAPSNILEVDALYDVVKELTDNQKEAENILLEEKERYRVALEYSKDIFFSYDIQNHMLDIVNHETMSGHWPCEEFESWFIDPEYIYDMDRARVAEKLQSKADSLLVEFRMKWPTNADYVWVALSGKTVYDTDGERRKIVGSIRDIQEQKEKEEEQLRRNSTDAITGLYSYSAGIRYMEECRRVQYNGVMVNLLLHRLKEINENNGIVFGDMILEELGSLTLGICREYSERDGRPVVAMRLDGDEFTLWLENRTKEEAIAFTEQLLDKIELSFRAETLKVDVYVGIACAQEGQTSEKIICMAKLAQSRVVPGISKKYIAYEDIPEKERTKLPPLLGRDINTLDYGDDVSLVSLALNLFGKGADFPAQMMLIICKIGRFYQASDVLISVLRDDFKSNYLDYQWHKNGENITENVRQYRQEEREIFFRWLGQREVRYLSAEDSKDEIRRRFLSIHEGQYGIVMPMYDNGDYMGNICILGIGPEILENMEEYQNLAELGRVIQSQLTQQQHDIASKAKSDFLSRMSHEIRTPMNGIIGMTAIALQQEQSQERILDCLQKIQSSSNYLLGLINDILDMSKIESGKMKLELMNFNLQEMLDTIKELIITQAAVKDIDFIQDIDVRHNWLLADRMRISQVLINLLGNAVKFTPAKGRVTLTVQEIRTEEEAAVFYFAVRDTGIGIPKEDQKRVFRSFEQASEVNPSKQQGTGLGLSISSRLVQLMGSNIQLESEPGEGSTFSFSISLKLGENMEEEVKEEEISFKGCRILVVEDNELNAEIAMTLLEERDFAVDCVYNGAEAVERIRTTAPGTYDVILMDIMMPVMDGLEATRTIRSMEREDCHKIPIVAMSANAFDDDLRKSVECGMNGHLSKPVEVDKLYRMLGEVIFANRKD